MWFYGARPCPSPVHDQEKSAVATHDTIWHAALGRLPGGKGLDPLTVLCASTRIWKLIQVAVGSWAHILTLLVRAYVSMGIRSQMTNLIAYECLRFLSLLFNYQPQHTVHKSAAARQHLRSIFAF